MNTVFNIANAASDRFLGTRYVARSLRDELEAILEESRGVVIDFSGLSATQSFIDELIGSIILRHGPDILERITFKGCSEDIRGIIQFVTSCRALEYRKQKQH